jgi:hypothetical protein
MGGYAGPPAAGDWRESADVRQARVMLSQFGSPLRPGLTEDDWARVLRAVLAERDYIGAWLQRMLDAEYQAAPADEGKADAATEHSARVPDA